MQAAFHEQVKTRQTLVSMTVCMVCAILANPDELNLKAPVAMFVSRSMFHLAERYRLMTLLHLQWVNLVRAAERHAARRPGCRPYSGGLQCTSCAELFAPLLQPLNGWLSVWSFVCLPAVLENMDWLVPP